MAHVAGRIVWCKRGLWKLAFSRRGRFLLFFLASINSPLSMADAGSAPLPADETDIEKGAPVIVILPGVSEEVAARVLEQAASTVPPATFEKVGSVGPKTTPRQPKSTAASPWQNSREAMLVRASDVGAELAPEAKKRGNRSSGSKSGWTSSREQRIQQARASEDLENSVLTDLPRSKSPASGASHFSAPQGVANSSQKPVSVSVHDPHFLEALRPLTVLAAVPWTVDPTVCQASGPTFSSLVDRSAGKLLENQASEAAEAISLAEDALWCGQEVVSRGKLGQFWLLQGVHTARQSSSDDPFATLLAMDADWPVPTIYGSDVKAEFERAAAKNKGHDRVEIELDAKAWSGMSIYIDGSPMAGIPRMRLDEGLHYLQLGDSQGKALVGVMFSAAGMIGGRPIQVPPANFLPVSAEALQDRLVEDVQRGRFRPELDAALDRWLQNEARPWVAFLSPGEDAGHARVVWVFPGGRVEMHPVALR